MIVHRTPEELADIRDRVLEALLDSGRLPPALESALRLSLTGAGAELEVADTFEGPPGEMILFASGPRALVRFSLDIVGEVRVLEVYDDRAETDNPEVLRAEAARRLGDPAVPPPGTKVRFETEDFGLSVEEFPKGDLDVFYGVTDGLENGKVRVLADLNRGGGLLIGRDAADPRPLRVLVADPRRLEVLELPADAPPFESWVRLSEAELRAGGFR